MGSVPVNGASSSRSSCCILGWRQSSMRAHFSPNGYGEYWGSGFGVRTVRLTGRDFWMSIEAIKCEPGRHTGCRFVSCEFRDTIRSGRSSNKAAVTHLRVTTDSVSRHGQKLIRSLWSIGTHHLEERLAALSMANWQLVRENAPVP